MNTYAYGYTWVQACKRHKRIKRLTFVSLGVLALALIVIACSVAYTNTLDTYASMM